MYDLTNCIVVKKLRYFKDQFILTQPTVTTLSEFCISTLIGGSGASSLVEILLPQRVVVLGLVAAHLYLVLSQTGLIFM